MASTNTFSLRNRQKYLKVEILNYAFTQSELFKYLNWTSKGERRFIIKEYRNIKRNTIEYDRGIMTIIFGRAYEED